MGLRRPLPSKGTPNNPICLGVSNGWMEGALFFGGREMPFEILLKRISPTLKRITYKLNGHFSFFNDEDLYQEALVRLWQDFQAGKLSDKTDSYILQGCYFHLKNYIRKIQDKARLVSLDTLIDEEGRDLEEILSKESPEFCSNNLEIRIIFEHIQNNGFTKREKEIFNLCLDGFTTREIGKKLGISHVRVVKVRKHLRKKLEFLK